jgi:hypothetical protein
MDAGGLGIARVMGAESLASLSSPVHHCPIMAEVIKVGFRWPIKP